MKDIKTILSVNGQEKTFYDIEKINKLKLSDIKTLIAESEKNYRDQINNIAETIAKNNYKVVLISGPSSSGKTTSSKLISQRLVDLGIGSLVVSIDDFYIDLEDRPKLPNGNYDFESILSIDTKAFSAFMSSLITKNNARRPKYNFFTSKRAGWDNVKTESSDVIIVEGIHALHPDLMKTHEFDSTMLKVFICVDSCFTYNNEFIVTEQDLRLMRRMYRDAFARGTEPLKTLKLWENACKAEETNITPYKSSANFIVDTTMPYEIMLYKDYLYHALEKIDNKELTDKTITILSKVNTLSKDVVPENSLLWEFLVNKE